MILTVAAAPGTDSDPTLGPDPAPTFVCASAARAERSSIDRVSWLTGCWQQSMGDRLIEEQWMVPRGGTMLGMGRTVKGDKTSDYEVMRIEQGDGHLVFTAHPSGQAEASFTSVELTNTKVVFENPSHDFPQRVIYMRLPDGSMAARIEGREAGKSRRVDFPMRRCSCPSGAGPIIGKAGK